MSVDFAHVDEHCQCGHQKVAPFIDGKRVWGSYAKCPPCDCRKCGGCQCYDLTGIMTACVNCGRPMVLR